MGEFGSEKQEVFFFSVTVSNQTHQNQKLELQITSPEFRDHHAVLTCPCLSFYRCESVEEVLYPRGKS